MSSKSTKLVVGTFILVTVFPAAAVQADFIKNLTVGLSLFDYQSNLQRNLLGDGWDYSTVASYNNREFDFGLAQLTLTGDVFGDFGFTRRGIPKADFVLNTGQTPLSYVYEDVNGLQNYRAEGSVLINIDTTINALGFYNKTLHISNRGQFELSGLVDDSGTLDYDIGPINVSGNIFIDILAAITQPFFAATGTQNPFAALSGSSGIVAGMTETIEEIKARLKAGDVLSEQELGILINNSVLASMIGSPELTGNLLDDLMLPQDVLNEIDDGVEMASLLGPNPIPEPTAVGLLVLGLLCIRTRRRPGRA